MKTHEVIIIYECRPPRGGTHFTYSVLQTFLRISFVSKVFCTFAAYMRRLPHILLCLWALCMLIGCAGDGYTPALRTADSLMNDSPSVALAMLDSLKGEAQGWSKAQRMRYHLLTMKARNKAYVDFTSDSLAKDVVEYYDNHGTANDRLLAHYLLGCVYRDLGESPHAVDCFQDAVACVDTTAKDCDYYTLSSVYSQMADQYRMQLLLSYEIDARWKASHYAGLAKDTLHMIYDMDLASGAYILLNKVDSGEIVQKQVVKLYQKHGYKRHSLEASTVLISLYLHKPDKGKKIKELLTTFDKEYDLFDKDGNLPPAKRQYFYYKGKYFDQINRLDSAEYYYRKIYHLGMTYSTKDVMYRGLLSIFEKRHQADSVSKYSKLFCEANDSSIAKKDQELTAKMSASYNYNRFQKLAQDNEKRANKNRMILIIIVGLVIIIALILWNLYQSEKHKKQRELEILKSDYSNATDEYNKNLHTLKLLEETHKSTISEMLKELTHTQDENISFRQQLEDQIAQYETTKEELENENESLKEKIARLQKEEGISKYIDKSKRFKDTAIVDRFMLIAESPLMMPDDDEWEELVNTTSDYYPELIRDMDKLHGISVQEIRLCILVAMSIRESDVARMMGVSNQRVSNIKSALNKKLFGDSSARSLYKNLSHRYDIFSQLAEA